MDSFDEISRKREYLFYIIVDREFASEIKQRVRNLLKRLIFQTEEEINFIPVKLSPTGERPATHFAMRMQIRGKEAKRIANYASNAAPRDVFTWMLTPLERVLWTRKDGFGPFTEDTWSFHQFINEDPVNLKIIGT